MLVPEFRKAYNLKTKAYRDRKKAENMTARDEHFRSQNIMQFFRMSNNPQYGTEVEINWTLRSLTTAKQYR
jgi:hypothetical protein